MNDTFAVQSHMQRAMCKISAARDSLQGEAFVFCDDAGFDDHDRRSLRRMSDSEKRQSPVRL